MTKLSVKEQEASETEDTKHCTNCKKIKPLFEFGVDPKGRKLSQAWCHECKNKRNIADNLFARYGMSLEDYDKMFEKQGGKCKICGSKTPGSNRGRFSVDHCHSTGKVRGLLCQHCNTSLGGFKDDPKILMSAIQYLIDSRK